MQLVETKVKAVLTLMTQRGDRWHTIQYPAQ